MPPCSRNVAFKIILLPRSIWDTIHTLRSHCVLCIKNCPFYALFIQYQHNTHGFWVVEFSTKISMISTTPTPSSSSMNRLTAEEIRSLRRFSTFFMAKSSFPRIFLCQAPEADQGIFRCYALQSRSSCRIQSTSVRKTRRQGAGI